MKPFKTCLILSLVSAFWGTPTQALKEVDCKNALGKIHNQVGEGFPVAMVVRPGDRPNLPPAFSSYLDHIIQGALLRLAQGEPPNPAVFRDNIDDLVAAGRSDSERQRIAKIGQGMVGWLHRYQKKPELLSQLRANFKQAKALGLSDAEAIALARLGQFSEGETKALKSLLETTAPFRLDPAHALQLAGDIGFKRILDYLELGSILQRHPELPEKWYSLWVQEHGGDRLFRKFRLEPVTRKALEKFGIELDPERVNILGRIFLDASRRFTPRMFPEERKAIAYFYTTKRLRQMAGTVIQSKVQSEDQQWLDSRNIRKITREKAKEIGLRFSGTHREIQTDLEEVAAQEISRSRSLIGMGDPAVGRLLWIPSFRDGSVADFLAINEKNNRYYIGEVKSHHHLDDEAFKKATRQLANTLHYLRLRKGKDVPVDLEILVRESSTWKSEYSVDPVTRELLDKDRKPVFIYEYPIRVRFLNR